MEIRRGRPVVADEELVRGELAVALADDAEPEWLERTRVEPLARLDVPHPQVNVVEEPASVRLGHRAEA